MRLKLDFDRSRRNQFHNALFNTPAWNDSPLLNMHALQMTRAANGNQLTDTFYSTGISGFPGTNAYRASVTLPDGNVFFVPFTATQARVYNPATNTVRVLTGYTFPGGNSHRSGILLDDGRLFIVPQNSTIALLYDYRNDSFTEVTAATWPGTSLRSWAVKLTGNKIFFWSDDVAATHWIYDATLNSVVSASLQPMDTAGYNSPPTVLEDGRLLIIPRTTGLTNVKIYNLATNTTSSVDGLVATSTNWYFGKALLPNNKVLICPSNGDTFSLFDPTTNTISTVTTITAGTNKYRPAVFLDDGRVQLPSWAGGLQDTIYYDWKTNTTTIGGLYDGFAQGNGAIMADGRLAYAPGNSTTLYVWGDSSYGGNKLHSTKYLNACENAGQGA